MTHVVVVTYDNTDPQVFGPYPSQADADAAVLRIKAGLSDRQWDHISDVSTAKLKSA